MNFNYVTMQMIESEGRNLSSFSSSFSELRFDELSGSGIRKRDPGNVQERHVGLAIILLCTSSFYLTRE